MVIAYPVDFEIGIFSSPNLIDWTPESNFSSYGVTGLQYECPNLIEIPVESSDPDTPDSLYLMLISINPGAPLGGSVSEYFIGNFNGTHFEALDSTVRFTDFSKDNYAAQFFYGIPSSDHQISLNWASNWQYTNVVPTAGSELGDGFRSVMTVPRAHFLKDLPRFGLSLISYPHNIQSVFDSELASNASLNNGTILLDLGSVASGAVYFEANVTGLTSPESLDGSINVTFSSSVSGESISCGTFVATGDIWLDRGHTNGFESPFFTDKFSATGLYNPADGAWRLSGILDRSIIEVFLNGGELSASSVFFPTSPLDTMALRIAGLDETATASVGVWALKAVWESLADGNGTVLGNATRAGMGSMRMF